MPWVNDLLIDIYLENFKTRATRLVLCSAWPEDFAGINSVRLGDKALSDASFTGPTSVEDGSGRRLILGAISEGTSHETGMASVWVLADDDRSDILAVQDFDEPKPVVEDEDWSLPAIEIEQPSWPYGV